MKLQAYAKYTLRLAAMTLAVWFAVSYAAICFSPQLNTVVIFGFPLSYCLGAQGSLVVFVILIFNYAFKMNKADVEYEFHEETG